MQACLCMLIWRATHNVAPYRMLRLEVQRSQGSAEQGFTVHPSGGREGCFEGGDLEDKVQPAARRPAGSDPLSVALALRQPPNGRLCLLCGLLHARLSLFLLCGQFCLLCKSHAGVCTHGSPAGATVPATEHGRSRQTAISQEHAW